MPAGPPRDSQGGDAAIDRGGQVDPDALLKLYEQQTGDDETPIAVSFTLMRDLNKRLDRYLVDRIPFLSRTSLQRLIKEQAVMVNGRPGKPSTKLRKGDTVAVILPPPPSSEIPAEDIPLDVLFEDDELVIVNKADDIIVHPARGNRTGTMINGLAWHFLHRSGGGLSAVGEEFARPGVVHRLDRHTTGAIAFAKTETAHWRLARQFEQRKVNKRYLAIVHGRMETLADVIDVPLGKHPTAREKYAVRWDDTGKPSVTIYRVREVYEQFTLVELELKTGRTHQIRVHLSYLGYPIAGDDIYGGRHLIVGDLTGPVGLADRSPRDPLLTRQALHATVLGFVHPITDEPLEFQAPLPADLLDVVTLLRRLQLLSTPSVAGATIDLAAITAT
jgi:23S rRNA pseudouridine1911/1915/1917 synthase